MNQRIASLLSVLLLALATACGSSKPSTASEPQATEKRAHSDPSDFCERYTRMYCTHESGDDGQLVETTYDKLEPADQASVAEACQASYSAATEAEIEAMESCLGSVASCDTAERCITR